MLGFPFLPFGLYSNNKKPIPDGFDQSNWTLRKHFKFLSEIIISRVQSRPWQSRTDVNKPTLQMFFPIPDQIRNCYKILLSAFKLDQNWYLRILAVKKSAENIVYAEKELFSPVFSTLFVNAFLITRFYFM